MPRGIDAALRELPGGAYDAQISPDGDIMTADFFDTSIVVSLLSDRRANEAEVLDSRLRRGWIGNEYTPGFEGGSKLWLFEQSRLTRTVMTSIADAAREALQWLVDDGFAVAIRNVSVNLMAPSSPITGIRLEVEIQRSISSTETRYFDLWPITGTGVGAEEEEEETPGESELHSKSIHYDDGNDYMYTAETPLGFSTKWSVAFWWKHTGSTPPGSRCIVSVMESTKTNSLIAFSSQTYLDDDVLNLICQNTIGTQNKDFRMPNVLETNVWKHVVATFDGGAAAASQLHLYVDGVEPPGLTKFKDDSCTQANAARRVCLGAANHAAYGQALYPGRHWETMIWDAKLDADAVAALYNGGYPQTINPNVNFGNYNYSSDLLFWYRPTYDALDIGHNYVTGGGINLTTFNQVDASDIVDDYPGL